VVDPLGAPGVAFPTVSALKLGVATPERVSLELSLAGLGTRALAYLVDLALLFAVALVAYFAFTFAVPDVLAAATGLSSLARVAGLLAIFSVLWIYWTATEIFWNGQTVGKRLLRIRVVRRDGSPVGVLESAIRNLLRFVDFLPLCYPLGLFTMLVDPQHRRIGDLVAGTVLVRDVTIDLSKYDRAPSTAPPHAGLQLTPARLELVMDLLARFDALEDSARVRLARQLLAEAGQPTELVARLDAAQLRARLEAVVGRG
jgi:uncharacterized RDD family membrane protein YckC